MWENAHLLNKLQEVVGQQHISNDLALLSSQLVPINPEY